MVELLLLVREFGPAVAVYVFCLYSAAKREDRLSKRIVQLENQTHKVLLPLIEKTTQVISENTAVMQRLESCLQAE